MGSESVPTGPLVVKRDVSELEPHANSVVSRLLVHLPNKHIKTLPPLNHESALFLKTRKKVMVAEKLEYAKKT